MSYQKNSWSDGDIITAGKLNNIENGVESIETNVIQAASDISTLQNRVTALEESSEEGSTPADYQELVDDVASLKDDLSQMNTATSERLDLTTEGYPNEQIVNLEGYEIYNNSGFMGYRNVIVPYPGDGVYYFNPILQSGNNRPYSNLVFLDENGEDIKIYNASGSEVSSVQNNCNFDPFVFDGLNVTRVQHTWFSNLVSGTVRARVNFTLASTPAFLKCTTVYTAENYSTGDRSKAFFGLTKDAWYEEYKPYGGFDYQYADGLIDAIEDSVSISNSKVIAPAYDATVTYAVDDYVLYDGKLYKCITAISTAEAWNSVHWEELLLTDEFKDINESISMCVEEKETLPSPTNGVQCANPSMIRKTPSGTAYWYYYDWIDISRDGTYYRNPYNTAKSLQYVTFYNKFGEQLTGKNSNGNDVTTIGAVLNTDNAWITVSDNGRRLQTFVRNGERSNDIYFDCELAYIKGRNLQDTDNESWGVTYNEYSDTYVQYDGSQDPSTLEKEYNADMAKFVRNYLSIYGAFVGNDMYNFTYPEKSDSVFVKAVKYYMQRFDRENKNIIRFGTFNKFVSRGSGNWADIKRELADYAIDVCGFQECAPIVTDGVVTDEIGRYLQSYQFAGYVPQEATVDKALVTHWTLTSSDNLTILTYDGGVSTCVRGKMNIVPPLWYSNAISNIATLSVYSCHLSSGGKTIDGTYYSSFEIRKKEIEGLLAIIAEDTSDFIIVVGDTNCFETGFDIPTGTHYEWEMFRQAGLTPALPGYESTVTADLQNKYFCKADNGKVYCIAAYDQIFFSANVSMDNYGVIDSNRYMMESDVSKVISDHCMIYADLKFDFEAVAQNKLKDIAVT